MNKIFFLRQLSKVLILVLLFSCKNNKESNFTILEYSINTDKILEFKKDLDYTNRFGLKIINKKKVLINLSKKKNFLLFNLNDSSVQEVQTKLQDYDIDAVKYDTDNSNVIIKNNLYKFSYLNKTFDSIRNIQLDKNEFIIHNLYCETLFKFKDFYFLQYGDENKYNRLDDKALLFFNKDSSFKEINTPKELKHGYIHYNDICIDAVDNNLYYTYATIPTIYKYDIANKIENSSKIENSNYILFDTTKLTDMKYIYDYSYETTYNIKLLSDNTRVFLIQRYQKDKINYYNLIVFDKDLKLISKSKISHTVDPNFIFLADNKLNFLTIKDKKIYEYNFK